MDHEKKSIQVVILPYHGQGHMNTMLQFAKRLAWKNVHVTIATTITTTHQIMPKISHYKNSISFEPIYDDTDDSKLHIVDRMARFEAEAASNLAKILHDKKEKGYNKKCLLVYHISFNWALVVARKQNVATAVFFTTAAASFVCYYRLYLEIQRPGMDKLELPSVLPPSELIVQKLPKSFFAYGDYDSPSNANMMLHPLGFVWIA